MYCYAEVQYLKSNQIKSNHFYCHITTEQVPWWVKFLWACSRQCKKKQQTIYIWTDSAKKTALEHLQCSRQCKKNNNNNLHMDRQCKKTTNNLHMDRQCKKNALEHLQCSRQCKKKKKQFTYGQYIFTDCTENNVQNTHTYTQYT